ncbi:MAG TPA: type II toxin-antitoxin system RelE/ParE family toxin [Anaerolineae bacterium]|nr:type II toxin-antitoxin system RelE/ParE family toxin [Anaerolineae bacterium]HIP73056.1 type II toxin-antitoxin system RelE/ParE family toxin [Anaerolineae bacterium]
MYKVAYQKRAERTLLKLPGHLVTRIQTKLEQIALNPYARHNNVTKLRDQPGYRLRVGDWRIIYEIHDDKLIVLVMKIAPRGSVYR